MQQSDLEDLIPGLNEQETMQWADGMRRALMHRLLTDQDFFVANLEQLRPEYFQDDAHQMMLIVARDYHGKHRHLPPLAVIQHEITSNFPEREAELGAELYACLEYIDDVVVAPEYLQSQVDRFCRAERLKQALRDAFHEVQSGTIDEVESIMRRALADVAPASMTTSLRDGFEGWVEELVADHEQQRRHSLGFPALDQMLNGGMRGGELALWIGPPGSGKSAMLCQVGVTNVMAGRKVLHVSLENSEHITLGRYFANLLDTPMADFLPRIPRMRDKWAALAPALRGDLKIRWFPSRSASVNDLRQLIRSLETKEGWRPDIVLLDYVDELRPVANASTYESQGHLIGELRGLMGEVGALGVSATQTNRQGGAVTVIDDQEIGDSYVKLRVADVMVSINMQPLERSKNLLRLFLMKNRNGTAKQVVFVDAHFEKCSFTEIEEREYDERKERS